MKLSGSWCFDTFCTGNQICYGDLKPGARFRYTLLLPLGTTMWISLATTTTRPSPRRSCTTWPPTPTSSRPGWTGSTSQGRQLLDRVVSRDFEPFCIQYCSWSKTGTVPVPGTYSKLLRVFYFRRESLNSGVRAVVDNTNTFGKSFVAFENFKHL